ncbi:MAG TPA: hypothetical protein VM165_07420 [Planctomycetaceae bacterium]|nr:hypothetical protein [Planctomycetaceae bacterium]
MPSTTSGNTAAERLSSLVRAILAGDALDARAYAQELCELPLSGVPRPAMAEELELIVAAAVIELLADRLQQSPPAWTGTVNGCHEPLYLVASANRFPNLRRQCDLESPWPLRRRNLFAPGNYLSWV